MRPNIEDISDSAELRRWYWLKTELAKEAKRLGLKSSGAKFTILERLCHFHDTGEMALPDDKAQRTTSKFDWHATDLTAETVITDNYKNTQNVRRFFKAHADPNFKFNISFMEWLKANVGKTLGDAAAYWLSQQDDKTETKIKPHNQLNQYLRDFMADNPALGIEDARRAWALKKELPSETGRRRYERSDLDL